MKIITLLLVVTIVLCLACGGKTASNANTNSVGNFATIDNSPAKNSNLTGSNASANTPTNGSNSNISTKINTPTEQTMPADPQLQKQIEDQQKETSDIRKAANAAREEPKKPVGKPPAGAPKSY